MHKSSEVGDLLFHSIRSRVIDRLERLDPALTYHNLAHTMDVLDQCERIAREEGLSEHQIYLLRVAALYHDTGFLRTYSRHEEVSCQIFLEDADEFEFNEAERKTIQELILVTKVPQQPTNASERVICDADLDYLGRDDFFPIGDNLRREFLHFGMVRSDEEWSALQIRFLTNHHYHTRSSQHLREAAKQQNMMRLL